MTPIPKENQIFVSLDLCDNNSRWPVVSLTKSHWYGNSFHGIMSSWYWRHRAAGCLRIPIRVRPEANQSWHPQWGTERQTTEDYVTKISTDTPTRVEWGLNSRKELWPSAAADIFRRIIPICRVPFGTKTVFVPHNLFLTILIAVL